MVSADVVMPGGTLRTVAGDELPPLVGRERGIVVRVTLQTRRAEGDTPYALTAAGHEKRAGAVSDVFHKKGPLWRLAFLSPEMASLRGLGGGHLHFGA